MTVFSKPNAIIYVRRSGLVTAGKKLAPARLTFNPEQMSNLEVLQDTSFSETLQDFFAKNGLKGKHVLMVLDDSVVFTKTVALDSDGQPGAVADAFIDEMPLDEGKRACLRVLTESELKLYATNSQLYGAIADALDQVSIAKLLAVTPASAYPPSDSKQLAAAIQQYIHDTSVRSQANFLNTAIL
jgi:hypothetical protein